MFSVDLPDYTKRNLSKRQKERIKRKEKRIERHLSREYGFDSSGGETADKIDQWVSEDEDNDELLLDSEREFFELFEGNNDIPIKTTGYVWYNSQRRIGRIIKSIVDGNLSDNKTTILILRDSEQTIYRLGIPRSQENGILSNVIKQGYVLTKININYTDNG